MNDRDLINAFVMYLQEHGFPDLKVDSWPEDENRNSPEIDAVAGALAIEHTSIDTLPNHRRDSDWFMRVAGGLEQELPINPQFRLNVTLEYEAVTRGRTGAQFATLSKNGSLTRQCIWSMDATYLTTSQAFHSDST